VVLTMVCVTPGSPMRAMTMQKATLTMKHTTWLRVMALMAQVTARQASAYR
jgi:hypothetical protein